MIQITVEVGDEGRVDKALARHFPEAGRRQLAELFDAGAVRIYPKGTCSPGSSLAHPKGTGMPGGSLAHGKRAKKGDRVVAGDVIELAQAPVSGEALRPVADEVALEVLLERPELVVVAKPAGMPSQPLRAGERGTAANGIVTRWPECVAIGDDPRDGGLVHRLDVGTSGALVAARTLAMYRALRDAFGQGLVDKEYLAITDGRPVSRESDAPLVQRGDHVRVDHAEGLPAYTRFDVERASEAHALVRCFAQTGRMHQVRAHLAHVGSPIAGDVLYGGVAMAGHDGFFLHAARIALPVGDEKLVVEAPLPARFTAALAASGL